MRIIYVQKLGVLLGLSFGRLAPWSKVVTLKMWPGVNFINFYFPNNEWHGIGIQWSTVSYFIGNDVNGNAQYWANPILFFKKNYNFRKKNTLLTVKEPITSFRHYPVHELEKKDERKLKIDGRWKKIKEKSLGHFLSSHCLGCYCCSFSAAIGTENQPHDDNEQWNTTFYISIF